MFGAGASRTPGPKFGPSRLHDWGITFLSLRGLVCEAGTLPAPCLDGVFSGCVNPCVETRSWFHNHLVAGGCGNSRMRPSFRTILRPCSP